MNCAICSDPLVSYNIRWTDTHGICACRTCGAPYRIYHYNPNDKSRVDKPPELLIQEAGLPITKQYWNTHKRNCAPGAFNIPGSSYEVATPEDFETINQFFHEHIEDLPPTEPTP